MLDLFDPPHRRIKDKREIRYLYTKYGEDAPAVLSKRANDNSLSARDRRHWQRLARKAGQQKSKWMSELKSG